MYCNKCETIMIDKFFKIKCMLNINLSMQTYIMILLSHSTLKEFIFLHISLLFDFMQH